MTDTESKLIVGALLHDIGKVIYLPESDTGNHSQSGYDFLKSQVGMEESAILEPVLYHHADMLKSAALAKDSPAYIVHMADDIASAADRRQGENENTGFKVSLPVRSIFNRLNGNEQELYYAPATLDPKGGINYPIPDKKKFDESFYRKVMADISRTLKDLDGRPERISALLEILEADLSYVPSQAESGEAADISLYDHVKMTAAISSCIYLYTQENNLHDYELHLYRNASDFYAKETFLMYSMDVSGIQDFIYTITSEHALRTLRARSFYLEIMMEHIIDSLLEKLHLSRANLIYSGGGHCYLLLPNTESTKNILRENTEALNQWLLDTFQISLYVADGYAQCSANALQNQPDGSYSQIFRDISTMISAKKSHRYAPADLVKMNTMQEPDYARECKVCKRIAKVGEDGECRICKAIEKFSTKILYSEYYTVLSQKKEGALPLPGDACLVADDSSTIEARVQEETCVRTYRKNGLHDTKTATTKLWVGDYTTGKPAQDMAQEAEGIDRIAILRADVDNLGHAFVAGFENPKNNNRYVTLSRTATLSRQLSLFFKCHINQILREPEYTISGQPSRGRNVTICYSGGDDLFIVGAWNEVIEAAVGIRRKFQQYTQGMLTLSAGIGIYQPGYPISASAREVADLEDASKHLPGKNAVTLFPDGERHSLQDEVGMTVSVNDGTYNWNTFEQKVVGEKYHSLDKFFTASDDRGNSFLYHLLALIRNRKEKIYFARYVYLLSRLEPDKEAPPEQIENYKEFSEKMYRWYLEETDCRELKTAMNLYAYLKRKREDEEA